MMNSQDVDDAYSVEYDKSLEHARIRWNAYQQERMQHEEMEAVARKFIALLSQEVRSLHSEFTPHVVNGTSHPSQGTIRTNPFLSELLNRWRDTSSSYRRSSQPVFQFFQQELGKLRSLYRIEQESSTQANPYLPEAIDWKEVQLATIMGKYTALIEAQQEIREAVVEEAETMAVDSNGDRGMLSAKQSVALLMSLLHEALGEGAEAINMDAFIRMTHQMIGRSVGNIRKEIKLWKTNEMTDHRGNLEVVRTLLDDLKLGLKLTELEAAISRGQDKRIEKKRK